MLLYVPLQRSISRLSIYIHRHCICSFVVYQGINARSAARMYYGRGAHTGASESVQDPVHAHKHPKQGTTW
jgi:hypothetical protein